MSHAIVSFELFRELATPGANSLVAMLSAAPSFTVDTALYLAKRALPEEHDPAHLVSTITSYDFVDFTGGEYRLDPRVRAQSANSTLRGGFLEGGRLLGVLHQYWSNGRQSETAEAPTSDEEIEASHVSRRPNYFHFEAAHPYHLAFSRREEALSEYVRIFHEDRSYIGRYLLGWWSDFQQKVNLLPPDAYEPSFLLGMTLYSEGAIDQALRLLRPVADLSENSLEVAIAAHVVANIGMQRGMAINVRGYLQRAVTISQLKSSEPFQRNLAHSLHTRARYFMDRERDHLRQAEADLDQSLELRRANNDLYGESSVELTLARLYEDLNSGNAERHFREAIRLKRQIGDDEGLAIALNSFGSYLLSRGITEAREVLLESIELGKSLGDTRHVSQASLTLARVISRTDEPPDLPRSYFEQAYHFAERDKDARQESFILNSWARYEIDHDTARAVELAQRSVDTARRIGLDRHVPIALNTLGFAYYRMKDSAQALDCFDSALRLTKDLETRGISWNGKAMVLFELLGDRNSAVRAIRAAIEAERRTPGRRRLKEYEDRLRMLSRV
jgi:tetratricopeptide (TPR) repeat protein